MGLSPSLRHIVTQVSPRCRSGDTTQSSIGMCRHGGSGVRPRRAGYLPGLPDSRSGRGGGAAWAAARPRGAYGTPRQAAERAGSPV